MLVLALCLVSFVVDLLYKEMYNKIHNKSTTNQATNRSNAVWIMICCGFVVAQEPIAKQITVGLMKLYVT